MAEKYAWAAAMARSNIGLEPLDDSFKDLKFKSLSDAVMEGFAGLYENEEMLGMFIEEAEAWEDRWAEDV